MAAYVVIVLFPKLLERTGSRKRPTNKITGGDNRFARLHIKHGAIQAFGRYPTERSRIGRLERHHQERECDLQTRPHASAFDGTIRIDTHVLQSDLKVDRLYNRKALVTVCSPY